MALDDATAEGYETGSCFAGMGTFKAPTTQNNTAAFLHFIGWGGWHSFTALVGVLAFLHVIGLRVWGREVWGEESVYATRRMA
jgi:hypothetical protein